MRGHTGLMMALPKRHRERPAPMISQRVHTMHGPNVRYRHVVIWPRVRAQDRPVVALPAAHVERPHAVAAHVAQCHRRPGLRSWSCAHRGRIFAPAVPPQVPARRNGIAEAQHKPCPVLICQGGDATLPGVAPPPGGRPFSPGS
jgi:hypothetical protein